MRYCTNLLCLVAFSMLFPGCKKQSPNLLIPRITSGWWQLTTTYPDISPYEYTPGNNKVCDFTIFQAADSTWQLIACIRGNNYPGRNRFFYRWEGKGLQDTLWQEKGVFLSTGYGSNPDGFGFVYDSTLFPVAGKLQAPHCIKHNNKYYLFYNNAGAQCMLSEDGKDFIHLKNDEGSYTFFEMGRDLMVFRDSINNRWITYYTDSDTEPQSMAAKTAETLTGMWSEKITVFDGHSNTRSPIYPHEFAESPFVLNFNDDYYLFAQLMVFHSKDPLSFTNKIAELESTLYHERAWAPEIIEGNDGQLYIAAYRPDGIWMAKIEFQ